MSHRNTAILIDGGFFLKRLPKPGTRTPLQ